MKRIDYIKKYIKMILINGVEIKPTKISCNSTLQYEIRHNINWINQGGCGFFCLYYIVYNFLLRRKINEIYVCSTETDKNCHFILKEGDFYIDGNNIWNEEQLKELYSYEKISFFDLILNLIFSSWDKKYDRKQNKLLRQIIKNKLKDEKR